MRKSLRIAALLLTLPGVVAPTRVNSLILTKGDLHLFSRQTRWRMKSCTIALLVTITVGCATISTDAEHKTSVFAEIAHQDVYGEYDEIIKAHIARSQATGSNKYDALTVLALESLVLKTPADWRPLHALAWVYATYEEYAGDGTLNKRALEYALRAREGNPSDSAIYEMLACAYMRNRMFSEARTAVTQGLELAKTEDEKRPLQNLIRHLDVVESFFEHFGPQATAELTCR